MKLVTSFTTTITLVLATVCLADNTTAGSAITSRYWDCCKPSCAWKDKAKVTSPILTCDANNNPLKDFNAGTGCNGGTAFACANQTPWAVNDTFSYGFVGAFIKGGAESTWCSSCYQLTFTDSTLKGKTMVVQATNTDYDTPDENIFTFAIPGGNNSYSGCATQYNVASSVFGVNKTGVSSRSECDDLPETLRVGCYWRFDWFLDAEAPTLNFTRISCPTALTNITGSIRDDDTSISSSSSKSAASSLSTLSLIELVCVVALPLLGSVFLS